MNFTDLLPTKWRLLRVPAKPQLRFTRNRARTPKDALPHAVGNSAA
jgi:hypothetical protein